MKFEECKKLFDLDKIEELIRNESGVLWLFIRSINRKEFLERFCISNNIALVEKNVNKQFEELNIFKQHAKVLPAIGNIKKVDFFIADIPFDLKTTYVPQNFIETERKKIGLKSELQELKSIAKKYKLSFDFNGKVKDITYEIIEKIKESESRECKQELETLFNFRKNLVLECIKLPNKIIQNLYENQGEMRFDASNRLFIILVDINNFEESWKLKRNTKLLTSKIVEYLDNFSKEKLMKQKITFTHKAKSGEFSAISDVIFIIKD